MKKESLQKNFYFSVLQHKKVKIYNKRLSYSPGSIQQRKNLDKVPAKAKKKISFALISEHQSYIWFC